MKIKLTLILTIILLIYSPAFTNENNCTQFKKLSSKYIECNAKKLKSKTSEKVATSKEKFEKSGINDKLKKFKKSKTLSDLIKE